jgi:hypothetical protein
MAATTSRKSNTIRRFIRRLRRKDRGDSRHATLNTWTWQSTKTKGLRRESSGSERPKKKCRSRKHEATVSLLRLT